MGLFEFVMILASVVIGRASPRSSPVGPTRPSPRDERATVTPRVRFGVTSYGVATLTACDRTLAATWTEPMAGMELAPVPPETFPTDILRPSEPVP